MDGRRSCVLVLLLLSSLTGCDQKRLLPLWPGNRTPDPHADRKPIGLPEPAPTDARGEKPKKLMPETLVAMGQFREQQASDLDLKPQGKEYLLDQARKAYLRALEIDPKFVPAHHHLARLYAKTGNQERALASYQQLLQLNPKDATMFYELALFHARNKEWPPSLEMLRQAIALDPENRAYIRSYGLTLARAGQVPESLAQLRRVLSDAEAHCMVARMMHHLKQEDACQQHLQVALRLDPELESARTLQAELRGDKPAAETVQARHEEPAADLPENEEPRPLPRQVLEANPADIDEDEYR